MNEQTTPAHDDPITLCCPCGHCGGTEWYCADGIADAILEQSRILGPKMSCGCYAVETDWRESPVRCRNTEHEEIVLESTPEFLAWLAGREEYV